MIGSHATAALAAHGSLPVLSYEGSSRMVYIDRENNVVYKVAVPPDLYEPHINILEYNNFMALRDIALPSPIAIPEVGLYIVDDVPVIAMEYITGDALSNCWCSAEEECLPNHCLPPEIVKLVSDYLDDTGGANTIRNADRYYIIDLGEARLSI